MPNRDKASYETNFKTSDSQGFVYGITAPIGFSFKWGLRKLTQYIVKTQLKSKNKCNGKLKYKTLRQSSFSVFISIVDIGAALPYRYGNEEGGFPDTLKLEQIFAPSVQLVWGFKDKPISFKAGLQYAPLLRGINENGNVLGDPDM